MLQPIAFANATAIVSAVFYLICRLLVGIMPDQMFAMMQSWAHTVNFESIQATGSLPMGSFIWGLLSLVIVVWITTYALISLYNSLSHKK